MTSVRVLPNSLTVVVSQFDLLVALFNEILAPSMIIIRCPSHALVNAELVPFPIPSECELSFWEVPGSHLEMTPPEFSLRDLDAIVLPQTKFVSMFSCRILARPRMLELIAPETVFFVGEVTLPCTPPGTAAAGRTTHTSGGGNHVMATMTSHSERGGVSPPRAR
jgi:hypothetical protein